MNEKAAAYVWLLSPARFKVASKTLPLRSEKGYGLLAFLAFSGDWVSRERAAYLFWPDTTTEKAQQNLRGLLHRLRSLEWLDGLEVEARRLRWQVETDVAAFKGALDEGELEKALALYGGPLLEGIEIGEAPEFSNWLEITREHLHSRWRDALHRRVRELQLLGSYDDAAKLLLALLEQDPLDEEALAAYLSTASLAGQRERALSVYRDFCETLKGLGLEPTSTTRRLAQAIREQGGEALETRPPAPSPAPPKTTPVPTPVTSFVGRDLEMSEIVHLLSKAECRLLTLAGPGGIGKTRLAMRAMQELSERYRDGVHFLPLSALTTPDFLPATIAQALGLPLQGQDDPLQQLIRHLGKKQLLLILDNFEQLLGGATLVSGLIQACPNLSVLVTSRERLNLAEEWLLLVEGLSFAKGDTANSKEALASEAVTLFVQRAAQVCPTFVPGEEDMSQAMKICRMVQGSPLAIELAAVWVRMMSCAELAQELQENLDLLSSSARNVPERHKSLRATFEHSWRLLTPAEQEVLRKLAVFRGGFRKEAAAVVAGASIAVLASLVDKSLLRVTSMGRYDRHPLVYGYTEEKLAEHPAEQARVQDKHGKYFLHFLQQREGELLGAKLKEALDAIEEELENIRVAWSWGVNRADYGELRDATFPLKTFFEVRARFQEGIVLFEQARAALEAHPTHPAALGFVTVAQGWLLYLSVERYEQAQQLARRGLELLRPLEESKGVLSALELLSAFAWRFGDYPQARAHLEEGMAITRAQQDLVRTADLLNHMGWIATLQGDSQQAKQYLLEASAIYRQTGKLEAIVTNLNTLGFCLLEAGDVQEAERLLLRALDLASEITYHAMIPHILNQLGFVAYQQGDYARAQALCLESLHKARGESQEDAQGWTLVILGKVALALGDDVGAQAYLMQALQREWSLRHVAPAIGALVALAELRIGQGRVEEAIVLLGMALHHPATGKDSKALAQRLLRELQGQLSAERLARALKRGENVNFDEAVAELLRHAPVDA